VGASNEHALAERHGSHRRCVPRSVRQLSGASLTRLTPAAKRRLLAVSLEEPRRRPLRLRAAADALIFYLSTSLPLGEVVSVPPEWGVGLISRDGRSLAYVAGWAEKQRKAITTLTAHGTNTAGADSPPRSAPGTNSTALDPNTFNSRSPTREHSRDYTPAGAQRAVVTPLTIRSSTPRRRSGGRSGERGCETSSVSVREELLRAGMPTQALHDDALDVERVERNIAMAHPARINVRADGDKGAAALAPFAAHPM
jgi:hypothetical protein